MRSRIERKIRQSNLANRSGECSACGNLIERNFAKFCRVCGKLLLEEYQPLDTLRASYRLQGKSFQFELAKKPKIEETSNLFGKNKNVAPATAWAFVVYSLVPYLGILFCPGAFLIGSFGVLKAYRQPLLGGIKTSLYSVALSVVIFAK